MCNVYIYLQADFIPPSENGSSSSISAGTVVGIVAATTFVIILLVGILWWKGCFRPEHTLEQGAYNDIDICLQSFCSNILMECASEEVLFSQIILFCAICI